MAYRFRFEFLLHLSAVREQREEAKFTVLSRQLATVEQRLRDCDKSLRELGENGRTALVEGLSGGELHFRQMWGNTLEARRLGWLQVAEKIRHEVAAQRERWLAARRRREALESLRQAESAVYAREMSRRQQSALDEIFLMRRRPGRN